MARTVSAMSPREKEVSLFRQLASLPRAYWMVNLMEMLERLAYYGVRVVIPIYIA
jgi:POT family proton-dependent oligopeptide transporter